MGKICLITTCLNEAAGIAQHIEALRRTCSVPGVAFHIVDGGSCDGTDTLLRQGLEPTEYSTLPGSGIYAAWNQAISCNKGYEYYCFLGVGDRLRPEGLMEAMALADARTPDVIYGPAEVTGSRKVIHPVPEGKMNDWRWGRIPFCHIGTLFSRNLFTHFGLFDESYRICGDLEWLLRIHRALSKGGRSLIYACTRSNLASIRSGGISSSASHLQTVITETKRAHTSHEVPIAAKRLLYFLISSARNHCLGRAT